jgi:glycine C-acetyltransferase
MNETVKKFYQQQLKQIDADGLLKEERIITSPQKAKIEVAGGQQVLNMCANNYLGLANHPEIIKAAKQSYNKWGYGLSSVRFICGTQEIHKELEQKISEFLETEDTILYTSCFETAVCLKQSFLKMML